MSRTNTKELFFVVLNNELIGEARACGVPSKCVHWWFPLFERGRMVGPLKVKVEHHQKLSETGLLVRRRCFIVQSWNDALLLPGFYKYVKSELPIRKRQRVA